MAGPAVLTSVLLAFGWVSLAAPSVKTASFDGRNVTRGQAVVGLEGFVPSDYDLEKMLFVSQDGDVSGRVMFLRDYLLTERLVLHPRVEANVAAKRVRSLRSTRA